jgi:hypothetical protein
VSPVVSDADEVLVARLLTTDVAATLGVGHERVVQERAAWARRHREELQAFTEKVVEDVQQYFHDCFIDTTWPRCSLHPNHPLWLHAGHWTCEKDGVVVARLGELRSLDRG